MLSYLSIKVRFVGHLVVVASFPSLQPGSGLSQNVMRGRRGFDQKLSDAVRCGLSSTIPCSCCLICSVCYPWDTVWGTNKGNKKLLTNKIRGSIKTYRPASSDLDLLVDAEDIGRVFLKAKKQIHSGVKEKAGREGVLLNYRWWLLIGPSRGFCVPCALCVFVCAWLQGCSLDEAVRVKCRAPVRSLSTEL